MNILSQATLEAPEGGGVSTHSTFLITASVVLTVELSKKLDKEMMGYLSSSSRVLI